MKIIKHIFKILSLMVLLSYKIVLAGDIDHFEITLLPEKAKIGEALDITIEAQDVNDNIVTDYEGSILVFSESDLEAEFPNILEENSYTFKATDEGKVKFENAVKFKNKGTQDIYVYDLNDDSILGIAEVEIIEEEKLEKIEIALLSPEDGITIGKQNVRVSGTTQKNHQVKIIINDSEEIKTISNSEGIFENEINNLKDGENKIKAVVLNFDDKIVGESKEVVVKLDTSSPRLKSIKITPKENVEPESELDIELISNKGLREVVLIVNDSLTQLEEKENGIYKGKIISPEEPGNYKVDIVLKDELGHEAKELGVEIISVKEIELETAGAPEVIEEQKEENPKQENKEDSKHLQIKGLKLTKLKTKSVLTWDEIKEAEGYNVYKKIEDGDIELIENVKEPRFEIDIIGDKIKYDYFAVKAIAKSASGEMYEGNLSEATKIQTGPEIWILLIFSMLIGGLLIFFTTKKRA